MDVVPGALEESAHHNQLVQLYWIARYDYEPNWAFHEHIHDFAQIIYIMEGEGSARISGYDTCLSPGMILFMLPGVSHALRADAGCTIRTMDIKFAILPGRLSEMLRQVSRPVMDRDYRVLHILRRVHQESIGKRDGHYQLCNALMTEALIFLHREACDMIPDDCPDLDIPLEDELVRKARDHLQSRFREDVAIREVSIALGISQQYLARCFKAQMGVTMNEYLMRYRVDQAKEHLRDIRRPIKKIASEVGFKSVHHFTRVFSRLESMPPAKWRHNRIDFGRSGITVTPGFVAVDITLDERNNELVGL